MKMIHRIERLEKFISEASGIPVKALRGRHRYSELPETRAILWVIQYDWFGCTYAYIGKVYKRDHTTIMHGCRKARKIPTLSKIVSKLIKNDPELFNQTKGFIPSKEWKL